LSFIYALKQLNTSQPEENNIMVNVSYVLNLLHVKWLKVCWPPVFIHFPIKCFLLLSSSFGLVSDVLHSKLDWYSVLNTLMSVQH